MKSNSTQTYLINKLFKRNNVKLLITNNIKYCHQETSLTFES